MKELAKATLVMSTIMAISTVAAYATVECIESARATIQRRRLLKKAACKSDV